MDVLYISEMEVWPKYGAKEFRILQNQDENVLILPVL